MFQDFSFFTYTHKILYILIHYFHLLHFYPFIYIVIALHVIPCQIHIGQKWCYLLSIFQRHLPNSNIVTSSNPNPYKLATTRKGGLHFLLSVNSNYYFDVKIKRGGFVGFVNDLINSGCLECVFFFIIELRKSKKTHSISTFIL